MRKRKIVKRVVLLAMLYYFCAIVSLWSYYPISELNPSLMIREAMRVITFQYFPSFTEYLPSFALLSVIFYALRNTWENKLKTVFVGKHFVVVMAGAVFIHFVANWIAHTITPPSLWLRPLIGSPTSFDFPLLQYLPVVVLGIWSATWVGGERRQVTNNIVYLGYGVLLANLALKYSFNFTHALGWIAPWINTPLRWPPSLSFLLNGLSYTFFFWILSRWMLRQHWLDYLTWILTYIGQRGMGFLLYHLLLLFVMKLLQVPPFSMWQLILFCGLIPVSYYSFEGLVGQAFSRYNKR